MTWIVVALASGALLALASGQLQNLGFGFAAAFVPGYALSHAPPGVEWLAAAETVLATFLWAAFIAVFARKYLD